MRWQNKEQSEEFLSVVTDIANIFELEIIQTSLNKERDEENKDIHEDVEIIRFINNFLTFSQPSPYIWLKDSKASHNIRLVMPIKKQIWQPLKGLLLGGWYVGDFAYVFENVWDIDDLQRELENYSDKFKDQDQDQDKAKAKEIFDKLNEFSNKFYNINLVSNIFYPCDLNEMYENVNNWREFEQFVNKFVEVYFKGYIGRLKEQESTDEHLQRYDAIAPLALQKSEISFFEVIKNCFNCRYLVFEAKYYQNSITQNEVWRTSKYLYKTALRSVAIIFTSSKYTDDGAKITQKGLLREQGKLILVVDKGDIEELLSNSQLDIETLLKNKLDDLMIHLNA